MQQKKRKQQSFEYGAIILLCSTMLVKVIGAVFKIPLSRILTTTGNGYFSAAYDLFTPIYSLAMAGLPIAVSRLVSENMTNKKYNDVRQSFKITKKIFRISGLVGFLLLLSLSYPFVMFSKAEPENVYSILAIAPSLFFCCIMSAYRGYYEGLRNMYPTAVSDVIEALGKLIFGLGFASAMLHWTNNLAFAAAGAMLGIVFGGMLSALFLILFYNIKGDGISKQELQNSPIAEDPKATTKALIAIAIPVVLASLANNIASLVDVSMVMRQLNNIVDSSANDIRAMFEASITEYNAIEIAKNRPELINDKIPEFLYGVRGQAFTLYNLVPTIASVLGVSALPVLVTAWKKNNKKLVKSNIESIIKLTAIIAMPAGMGYLFLGTPIMSLVFGTVAAEQIGGVMLSIYGVAAVFAGLSIPMTSMLQAIGKEKISLRNIAIGAGLKVVANLIFVNVLWFNIRGAAMGTLVCYLFIFIANLSSLIKYTGVVPNIYKTIIKPLIAAVMCGASALGVQYLLDGAGKIGTVAAIAVAAVVYFAVLVILNTFEPDDVVTLPKGEKILKIMTKLKLIR